MQSKPTTLNLQEGVLDFVEFSKHITILNGKDWDSMSEGEQMSEIMNSATIINKYMDDFVDQHGSEKIIKEYKLLKNIAQHKSDLKPSSELNTLLELASSSLAQNLNTASDLLNITNQYS